MERTLRILARMFEQNGTLYIGAAIAVIVLIVLVTMARRMRIKAATQASADNTVKSPMAADDIELTMIDDAAPSGGDESVVFELDETTTEQFNPDQLDQATAHQFDIDDDALDDIDDITIPKVGEAPPPRKPRFFSASWLHREKKKETVPAPADMATVDARTMDSAAECARLAEIERNMLALRELYEAGLIAPEVYVLKAREFAGQSA
ncbi:MAG: hypothetical protein ACPG8C_00390 [Parvibaculales bacterium]